MKYKYLFHSRFPENDCWSQSSELDRLGAAYGEYEYRRPRSVSAPAPLEAKKSASPARRSESLKWFFRLLPVAIALASALSTLAHDHGATVEFIPGSLTTTSIPTRTPDHSERDIRVQIGGEAAQRICAQLGAAAGKAPQTLIKEGGLTCDIDRSGDATAGFVVHPGGLVDSLDAKGFE